MPDNTFQNQGQDQLQGRQGDLGNDAVGYDGTVRNPDGSSTGEDLDGDAELTPNQQAEDDPEANREEQ